MHRDLKQRTCFIVHNDDEEIAKVLDFGVAKVEHGALALEARRPAPVRSSVPVFMSPEQAQGNKAVDYRSDLWSPDDRVRVFVREAPFFSDGLGIWCCRSACGSPVPSEAASVPLGFDAWFGPRDGARSRPRFQSAREMSEALREALGIEVREPERRPGSFDFESTELPSERTATKSKLLRRGSPLSKSAISERAELETLSADALPRDRARPIRPRPRSFITGARAISSKPRRVRPPFRRAPAWTVVAVAALALGLGLGGGLYALQHYDCGRRSWPSSLAHRPCSKPAEHSLPARRTDAREPAVEKEAVPVRSRTQRSPPRRALPRRAARPRRPSPGTARGRALLDAGSAPSRLRTAAGSSRPGDPCSEPKRVDELDDPR